MIRKKYRRLPWAYQAIILFLLGCSGENAETVNQQNLLSLENSENENEAEPEASIIRDYEDGDPITNRLATRLDKIDRRVSSTSQTPRRGTSPLKTLEPLVIGEAVDADDYPWQIGLSIRLGADGWRCGGVLVTQSIILTAAHCVDAADAQDFSVVRRLKATSISVYHGNRFFGTGSVLALDTKFGVVIHSRWKVDRRPMAFDLAILKLASPISGATPAPLQTADLVDRGAVVSGWGYYDSSSQLSDRLRAATVNLINNQSCSAQLRPNDRAYLSETIVCATSKVADACSGDSGGPLVIGSKTRPQTIGIVSWGPPVICGTPGPAQSLIGGYTKSAAVGKWVATKTNAPESLTSAAPDPLFKIEPVSIAPGIDR